MREIGTKRSSDELRIIYITLYGWIKALENGYLNVGELTATNGMRLVAEIQQLRKDNKEFNNYFKESISNEEKLMLYINH